MKQRKPDELYRARQSARVLAAAKFDLFPLRIGEKLPRDKGFLLHDYLAAGWDFEEWLRQGGNIGVKPRRDQMFIDVDPKNGGLHSFEVLCWEHGLNFEPYPIVHTGRGNGGFHLYMRLPTDGSRWRWHLKEYPGIDFQTLGRYVVAPGSIHPDTGLMYRLEPPLMAFEGESKLFAPDGLLSLLRKPPRPPATGAGGTLTVDQVAGLLEALDPVDYGQGGKHHDEWLDIGMACHEASDGEAVEVWLDWCAQDSQYGDDARTVNAARWDSFDSSRSDRVTYKTLLRAVAAAGGGRLVALLEGVAPAKDEFEDDAHDLERDFDLGEW